MIGLSINTLPVRIDVDRRSVRQALKDVHQLLAELLRHEHAPLSLAQRCSGIAPPSPLFCALLNYRYGTGSAVGEGSEPEPFEFLGGYERTHYPLTMVVEDLGDDFTLTLQVPERLGAGRMAGIVAHALRSVVSALQEQPAQFVCAINVLSPLERESLFDWGSGERHPRSGKALHRLFEAQARRTPQRVAMEHGDQAWSYAALDGQANAMAHRLVQQGVRPGDRVALLLERSVALVVAQLAVLKAGGVYVPLDPRHPPSRLAELVADCSAAALVCQSSPPFDVAGTAIVYPQDDATESGPVLKSRTEACACVMYTSGSTGMPKGVQVEHVGIERLVLDNGYLTFRQTDRVAFAANPAFDAASMEVWGPLLNGGCCVILGRDDLIVPHRLERVLAKRRISVLFLTTALFNQCARIVPGAFAGLRCLLTGGEQADPRAFAAVLSTGAAPQRLVHCYGPTETTTFAITNDVTSVSEDARQVPVGAPIADTDVYVLDASLLPAPIGVTGELYIGGAGVARGYLNRPALTAEHFLPDPFAGKAGARMYKTGDLGRWLPDGTLDYVGRKDAQVKIRGYRISPSEIVAQLLRYAGVQEAVVLALHEEGDRRLVAYFTAAEPLQAEGLRAHLAARLPEYMVPAAYVQLTALPLTRAGKVDRNALPVPDGYGCHAAVYEAPHGELEAVLAELWRQLLRVERIGRRDDFFELGGHSLLAVQLTSRLRTDLGVEVPLAELFAQPTLRGFAECVHAARRSVLPDIPVASREQPLPLSFEQQRLWFLSQLDGRAGAAYAIPAGVRLRGQLNVWALQAALDRIVARHEVLRTSFTSVGGAVVQVITEADGGFALERLDLEGHAQPESALERLVAQQAGLPFDLGTGPLIRGCLVRMSDEDHVLLVNMHHIVSDGWSMGVLLNEFGALYTAIAQGQPDPLPALAIQYADYAVWQRDWMTGETLQRQLDSWRSHLSGAPVRLDLPADHPRPPVQDYKGASMAVELDEQMTAGLKALGRRHGATLFMTLLAGWAALLARLSGQGEVVIGTPVANRTRVELEPLIGFFVNTLALRIDLSGAPTVSDLLAQVRATAMAAHDHQDIPFEQVVEALSPTRSLAHSPVFQVMFAWQNAPEGDLVLPGLQLQPVGAASETVKFDLELSLHEDGERIVGHIAYARALFEESTIARHLGHWRELLRGMPEDDARSVAHLPLLTHEEQHRILFDWNAGEATFPVHRCIHELFEEQVVRRPEAPALVFEGTTLSYADLNVRANRLAHHLIALGVAPDGRVAIALPRGIEMVVALLATLKAGGAYVPLDTDYPGARLAFMLSDSAPRALITDAKVLGTLGVSPPAMSVVEIDSPARPWDSLPGTNPRPANLTSQHLAYIIYTSGSTGVPKGVMVEHAQVMRLWSATQGVFEFGSDDVWTLFHSYAFDFSVWELWGALAHGGRLVVVPHLLARSPREFYALVCEQGVTVLNHTPGAFRQLIAAQADSALEHRLRIVIFGGEALTPATLAPWFACNGERTRLVNMYGITETTVHVTCRPLSLEDAQEGASPIGVPIADLRVVLLDAHGQLVPVGVVGEMYVGGAGLTRGYLNRPDLTAERFVPDPFAREPGSRMYRTGDLGRWRPDGTIEFLGRNDHQVKIRGLRIELGEIEVRLRQQPDVREAVVLAREEAPGDRRLVAYIVGEDAPEPEALRAYLAAQLPEYMVPAAYVRLQGLPLSSNGKLDRHSLPAPEDGAFGTRPYEPPQGEMESALVSIWSELLGRDRIGRHDDFFALGGHSLLALQVVSRLSPWLEREVPVHLLFLAPTVAEMAKELVRSNFSTMARNLVPIRTAGDHAPLFIVHAGDGEVGYARDLAPHLPSVRPVYALAATGFSSGETPLRDIAAMAASYLQAMRVVQPKGPYHLIGWSAGGTIAYEIARRLLDCSDSVGFLGLIDTAADQGSAEEPDEATALLHHLQPRAPAELLEGLRSGAAPGDIDGLLVACQALGVLPADIERSTLKRHLAVWYAILVALVRYVPAAISARLHLFCASGEERADPNLGWHAIAGERLHVTRVPGTHWSVLNDVHVSSLGAAISAALGNVTDRVFEEGLQRDDERDQG